jgi:hypothetical protein
MSLSDCAEIGDIFGRVWMTRWVCSVLLVGRRSRYIPFTNLTHSVQRQARFYQMIYVVNQ